MVKPQQQLIWDGKAAAAYILVLRKSSSTQSTIAKPQQQLIWDGKPQQQIIWDNKAPAKSGMAKPQPDSKVPVA